MVFHPFDVQELFLLTLLEDRRISFSTNEEESRRGSAELPEDNAVVAEKKSWFNFSFPFANDYYACLKLDLSVILQGT